MFKTIKKFFSKRARRRRLTVDLLRAQAERGVYLEWATALTRNTSTTSDAPIAPDDAEELEQCLLRMAKLDETCTTIAFELFNN